MITDQIPDSHTIGISILLHLLPGVLIGLGYWTVLPALQSAGYPSIMALMVAVALILVPFELGYLLLQGYRKHGRLSLKGLIAYRDAIPIWQYVIWVSLLFVGVGLIFTLMRPVDTFLQTTLFAWLPTLESGLEGGFDRDTLIVTYAMVAVFGALVGPIVEELYFRGYLLPRMAYAGKRAPLLHSFLFALYHVFTPWMILTRTLGMLPLVYAVRRRNLALSIIVHVMVNAIDVIAGVSLILAMGT